MTDGSRWIDPNSFFDDPLNVKEASRLAKKFVKGVKLLHNERISKCINCFKEDIDISRLKFL